MEGIKTFIVAQMIVMSRSDDNINMENIIRVVSALSKEEAIGKFVIGTNYIQSINQLTIECYEINRIKQL